MKHEQKPETTPLWLDIKPEYIDENFEKVLEYLRNSSVRSDLTDAFYQTTRDLLKQRVEKLLEERRQTPLFMYEDESMLDKCRFTVRLLGAFLLVNESTPLKDSAMTVLLSSLAILTGDVESVELSRVDHSTPLATFAVDSIMGSRGTKLPFSWNDIIDFNPHTLAFKISQTPKTVSKNGIAVYEGQGALKAGSTIRIAASDLSGFDKCNMESFSLLDGRISIMSRKEDRLKNSAQSEILELEQFTKDFIKRQKTVKPAGKKKYREGESANVHVTGFSGGHIRVTTTDSEHETVCGTIVFEQDNMFWFSEADFIDALSLGDLIEVNVLDAASGTFQLRDSFARYLIEECVPEIEESGFELVGTLVHQAKSMSWQTNAGFVVVTPLEKGYDIGDSARLAITYCGKDKYYGLINARILEETEEKFDVVALRRELLASFVFQDDIPDKEENVAGKFQPSVISELLRMLVLAQRHMSLPSERFRTLCTARILAEMIGDESDSRYIAFVSEYLENLVLFSKGEYEGMKPLAPSPEFGEARSVARREQIVRILMAYGKDEEDGMLSDIIDGGGDELLKKIAVLVQSCNRIDSFIDKSMQNVIKREIVRCLAMETEGDTDLEEENGNWLGIENSRQEFKVSIFEAPKNAKEQNQRINVFKTVCAFLNSQVGGTLYLGVNDLGYVYGLKADIERMERTVIGNYHGVDGYVRFLTDEMKKYFDLSILTHIDPQPLFDGQVVAIVVQPYTYGIVYLDGTPYVRIGSETVKMNETLERQLQDRAILGRNADMKVKSLMAAIRDKRCAILHKYSSSSSGEVKNRNVEPFLLTAKNTMVWCYDLDNKENRIFRIDRCEGVEVKSDVWSNEKLHKAGNSDIFHMSGKAPMHIVLSMTLMAKNLLVEEFPDSMNCLSQDKKTGCWLLETDVFALQGVGRFYLGLADEIEIIEGAELKKYAQEYVKRNFK